MVKWPEKIQGFKGPRVLVKGFKLFIKEDTDFYPFSPKATG
jgi:hypothetical protein